jgi:hypothetical protein
MTKIKEINQLHRQAMTFANEAYAADLKGDLSTALSLFTNAFEFESRAAYMLKDDYDAEPSRSVLCRSAASLGVDCGEFRKAERLVAMGLMGNPPEEICEELRDVLEKIHFSRHLGLRNASLDPGEFQMSLTGAAVGLGIVESAQFLKRADVLEKLLVRNAERMRCMPFRESGNANANSLNGFEIYYSVPRAASFAITIRIGRPLRQQMLPGFVSVSEVVDDFLLSIQQFNDGDGEGLRRRLDSDAYFNNFYSLAKKLAPDGTKIYNVGFTSIRGDERKEASLSHPARPSLRRIDENVKILRIIGEIHKADELRRGTPVIGIRDFEGKVHTVNVPLGLGDIVRPYWGERVELIAKQVSPNRFELVDIEKPNDRKE